MVKCPLCTNSERFLNDSSSLSRHVQYVHYNRSNDNEYHCIVTDCNFLIKGPTNILQHFNNHHKHEPGFEFLNKKNKTITNSQSLSTPSNLISFDNHDIESSIVELNEVNNESVEDCIPLYNLIEQNDLTIEDKFCDLIISFKKRYNVTQMAAISMTDEILTFIADGLDEGILFKSFI